MIGPVIKDLIDQNYVLMVRRSPTSYPSPYYATVHPRGEPGSGQHSVGTSPEDAIERLENYVKETGVLPRG